MKQDHFYCPNKNSRSFDASHLKTLKFDFEAFLRCFFLRFFQKLRDTRKDKKNFWDERTKKQTTIMLISVRKLFKFLRLLPLNRFE